MQLEESPYAWGTAIGLPRVLLCVSSMHVGLPGSPPPCAELRCSNWSPSTGLVERHRQRGLHNLQHGPGRMEPHHALPAVDSLHHVPNQPRLQRRQRHHPGRLCQGPACHGPRCLRFPPSARARTFCPLPQNPRAADSPVPHNGADARPPCRWPAERIATACASGFRLTAGKCVACPAGTFEYQTQACVPVHALHYTLTLALTL